jgi:hypothetical protein
MKKKNQMEVETDEGNQIHRPIWRHSVGSDTGLKEPIILRYEKDNQYKLDKITGTVGLPQGRRQNFVAFTTATSTNMLQQSTTTTSPKIGNQRTLLKWMPQKFQTSICSVQDSLVLLEEHLSSQKMGLNRLRMLELEMRCTRIDSDGEKLRILTKQETKQEELDPKEDLKQSQQTNIHFIAENEHSNGIMKNEAIKEFLESRDGLEQKKSQIIILVKYFQKEKKYKATKIFGGLSVHILGMDGWLIEEIEETDKLVKLLYQMGMTRQI